MTQNEKLLAETLLGVLIKVGVLRKGAILKIPELICAAETYCESDVYKPCPECGERCGHKVDCYEGMRRQNSTYKST